MSATNKTAVYELPIFLGTDVPSWLTDWNGAMGDIDTAIAAAKAAADAAASTAGTAATDIVTINGQITSLQNTVGTHTTQIGTISGNINTINSLIGNGTPTTTDQTIIGAINELNAKEGNLANLTTTDKSSLVAAINEVAGSGAGSVSVTGDGVATYASKLGDLFALVDMSKVTDNSRLVIESNTNHLVLRLFDKTASIISYAQCSCSSSNIYIRQALVQTTGAYRLSEGTTVSDKSSDVVTADTTIELYY